MKMRVGGEKVWTADLRTLKSWCETSWATRGGAVRLGLLFLLFREKNTQDGIEAFFRRHVHDMYTMSWESDESKKKKRKKRDTASSIADPLTSTSKYRIIRHLLDALVTAEVFFFQPTNTPPYRVSPPACLTAYHANKPTSCLPSVVLHWDYKALLYRELYSSSSATIIIIIMTNNTMIIIITIIGNHHDYHCCNL